MEEKPAAKATTATEPAKAKTADNGEQTFVGELKDVDGNVVLTVNVKAPKGALPEGATMRVKPIEAVEVADKVNEAVKAEAGEDKVAKSIMAVDIAFLDKDGSEVEPSKKVEVKITTALVKDADAPALVHIDEKKDTAEVVRGTTKVNADEKDTSTGHEDTLKFDTDKFSPYVVVEVGQADEEPAKAEPVIAMPAQSFEDKAGDVTVKVSAPEGAFAEGTTMSVEAVEADDVIESIESAVTGDVKQVAAVDITFRDAEGNQVQPLVPIKVTMTNATAPAKSEPTVVHVDDEGEASVVEQSMITSASDEVVFDADSFSVYAMVITTQYIAASGEAYDVTVTYGPEARIPEDAWLRVSEFEEGSEEWETARKAVLADKLAKGEYVNLDDFGFAALDISIMVGDEEIEPQAEVQVDLKVKDLPEVEDLSEVVAALEVQHHVETADGVIVDTVVGGEAESTFALATDEDTVAAKASEAVDPAGFDESDFAAIAPEAIEQAVETSFDTEVFSTFTITWRTGNDQRTITVHYVDESGADLPIANPAETYSNMTASSSSPAFLIYDIEGYEYSYTYRNNNNNRIAPILHKNNNNYWRYTTNITTGNNVTWTELSNRDNIYVVYKPKPTPTTGGTAKIDMDETWPEGEDAPQFTKSSTNNGNGTNTVSLAIQAGEKPVQATTPADIIVVFDVSGSMINNNLGDVTRLEAAKTATNAMADTLLNGENHDVRMALITFSTDAQQVQGFTDSYTTFSNRVDSLNAGGGTNWEKALKLANEMSGLREDAATFVVFVTDGDPTFRITRGDLANNNVDSFTSSNWQYVRTNGVFGQGDRDDYGRNFAFAVDQVSAIAGKNKNFYAIGISNDVTKVQNLTTQGGVAADHAFIASDKAAMEAAFKSITEAIKSELGFGDVAITDGITELAHVEMKVMQQVDPNSFTYYKVTSAGQQKWNPTSEGAGLASYDAATGSVKWNMGEGFQLQDDVTYMVTFRAWPSQEAYDLVAELNNGVKVYESGHDNSITAEERTQVVEIKAPTATEQGQYALKTNTDTVNATYSQTSTTGDTVTVSGETGLTATYHEGTIQNMDLASELLTVHKIFDHSLDPRTVGSVTLKLQRKVNGSEAPMADYNAPGTNSPLITLNDGNNWMYSFYVAPGFIVDGETLEWGYQFTVTEPEQYLGDDTVRYDLIAETVNPMVVDGKLELVGDDDQLGQLTAINRTRSAVEIHKTLYDFDGTTEIYPDIEFTITGQLLGPDGTPYTSQETGAPVAYYLYDRTGTPTTGRLHFPTTANISFKLKAGEFIRFVNVPEGCTFEFTEGTMPDNYEFKSLAAVGRQRAETDPPYTYSIELADDVAHLVEGQTTISTTNEGIIGNTNYKLDFYNKRVIELPEFELLKVDAENHEVKLADAEFSLFDGPRDAQETKQITTDANGNPLAIKTDENGQYIIGTLNPGTYYLYEDVAPDQHEANEEPVIITITLSGDSFTVQATQDGESVLSGPVDNVYTITVENERTTKFVRFKKTNEGGTPLGGAEFDFDNGTETIALTSYDADEEIEVDGAKVPVGGLMHDEDGVYTFEVRMSDNAYTLTETRPPEGYQKIGPVKIYVQTDQITTDPTTGVVVSGTGTAEDPYVIAIANNSGTTLPKTGGPGTTLFTITGSAMCLAAVVMYGFTSRRGRERRFD